MSILRNTDLRLVAGELSVAIVEALQTDREFNVAGSDDILNLEFRKLGIKAELLDDACVFARCKARVIFGFCTGDDHFARGENERGSLGFADTHDHSSETLIKNKTG